MEFLIAEKNIVPKSTEFLNEFPKYGNYKFEVSSRKIKALIIYFISEESTFMQQMNLFIQNI
jgi:hypothetical protein